MAQFFSSKREGTDSKDAKNYEDAKNNCVLVMGEVLYSPPDAKSTPKILYAPGIQTCIFVALVDKKRARHYAVGHFDINKEGKLEATVTEMGKNLLDNGTRAEDIQVTLVGGTYALDYCCHKQFNKISTMQVLGEPIGNALKNLGIKNNQITHKHYSWFANYRGLPFFAEWLPTYHVQVWDSGVVKVEVVRGKPKVPQGMQQGSVPLKYFEEKWPQLNARNKLDPHKDEAKLEYKKLKYS